MLLHTVSRLITTHRLDSVNCAPWPQLSHVKKDSLHLPYRSLFVGRSKLALHTLWVKFMPHGKFVSRRFQTDIGSGDTASQLVCVIYLIYEAIANHTQECKYDIRQIVTK